MDDIDPLDLDFGDEFGDEFADEFDEFTDNVDPENPAGNAEDLMNQVDEIISNVEELEKSVVEIEQFYSATGTSQPSKSSSSKEKEREKHGSNSKQQKQQEDEAQMKMAATRRMQELMRQFATILKQITQHRWAWPFMEPVDVAGLGLDDYHKVIEKPMDIGTIKAKMETEDDNGYKHVRDIYADVRLVFKNAMKYNDEKDDVHVMAKTLLEKFEEKWLQLLPKIAEEEKRQEEEEAKAQLDTQLSQETAFAIKANQTRNELHDLDMYLRELKDSVARQCRRMSTEEKKRLGDDLTRLCPEDLSLALDIVAQNNPNFQVTSQEVDLDMDAQSEYVLWKLKIFVRSALKERSNNTATHTNDGNGNDDHKKNNSKRRREICDALAKTKRTKKMGNM